MESLEEFKKNADLLVEIDLKGKSISDWYDEQKKLYNNNKMGTVIYGEEGENPSIKRFYGGKERGVCYKLLFDSDMTKQEYITLIKKMVDGLDI